MPTPLRLLALVSVLVFALVGCAGQQGSPVGSGEGLDVDWSSVDILSQDPGNDQNGQGVDLGNLRAFYDDQYLYIQVEILDSGEVDHFAVSLLPDEERRYWIYYSPDNGTVEMLTPTSSSRQPVDVEVYYGDTLEFILPMALFEAPVRIVEQVRAMTGSIAASDEVSGGIIPNQAGVVEYVTLVNPEPTYEAMVDAMATAVSPQIDQSRDGLFLHDGAVRFMTYNVLGGSHPDDVPEEEYSLDDGALPQILEIIQKTNPDVIAFQELHSWQQANPTVMDQLADAIGMEYVFCDEDQNSSVVTNDTAIFSRYPIVDYQIYTEVKNCFIHAQIEVEQGLRIHVFANHVSQSRELGCNQPVLGAMLEIASGYMDQLAVLVGDLNINNMVGFSDDAIPQQVCYDLIEDAGWEIAAINLIDQIYVTPGLAAYLAYPVGDDDLELLGVPEELVLAASDHAPVLWDLYFQDR